MVLGTLLLLLNTKHHMKANKSNKLDENIEREDTLYMELEGKSIKKRKSLPLIIIMILILILTLISTYSWTSMFELSIFTDFHNKVSEFPVLMDILGKPMTIGYYSQYGVNAFGSWDYIDLSIVLVLASLLIGLIYRVDIKKIAKSFTDSVRKFIRPTFYILLAYTLFVLNVNKIRKQKNIIFFMSCSSLKKSQVVNLALCLDYKAEICCMRDIHTL